MRYQSTDADRASSDRASQPVSLTVSGPSQNALTSNGPATSQIAGVLTGIAQRSIGRIVSEYDELSWGCSVVDGLGRAG